MIRKHDMNESAVDAIRGGMIPLLKYVCGSALCTACRTPFCLIPVTDRLILPSRDSF